MISGLPSDMWAIQRSGHRVTPQLWTRTPSPANAWIQLQVIEATITYDSAGAWPGRSLTATVLLETDGIPNLIESIDATSVDWGHAPLSPFGSWLKAEQLVYRLDQSPPILVPWGIFRVDGLSIDELSSTVTITASDPSAQVADRPFVTLNQGRVGATQSIQAKMNQIVSDVFGGGGIVPFWSSLIDFGSVADHPYGGRGGQYADARLDALGSLGVKLASGYRLICPRTGGALFKLIQPGASFSAFATAGHNLIFDDFSDSVDREGLFNEVVITYEVTKADGYGQNRTQQKRVVAQYVDAGEELAGTGPFGWSTRETVQVDIPAGTADPDGYAKDKALDVMGKSFAVSRHITLKSGPIYGLEQGDAVYVQTLAGPDGVRRKGTLTAATIPLHAGGGAWELQVAMVDTLDPSWKPRYYVIVDTTKYEDSFSWQELRPTTTVDLDTGTGSGKTKKLWQGWTVDHASKLVGGGTLTATSDGTNVVFRTTDRAWSESAAEHRYQAKASLTAAKGTLKARIGLDTNTQGIIWSDWVSFDSSARTKTHTLTLDTKRLVNPSAVTFGIRVETQGMSSGEQVRMNSASVDRAVRDKS